MVLQVQDLCFAYDEAWILEHISFDLAQASLCHLQGFNGAGKSTLLKCLAGILKPLQGEIKWANMQRPAYLGHHLGLHPQLSLRENILFGLDVLDLAQLDAYLKKTQLAHIQDEPCMHLSMGQRTKAALIRICLSAASVWLLDEPFANLDVLAQQWLYAEIHEHLAKQGTVIFTAHQMSFDLESLSVWSI